MPRIAYGNPTKMRAASLDIIRQANVLIARYQAQGYSLTLRQLYYQLVSRNVIPNKVESYNRLGDIIANGRMNGLVDWNAIVDRTRTTRQVSKWEGAAAALEAIADQYQIDKWRGQDQRVIVMVEKDALAGVIERPCRDFDVQWLSCRGYMSLTESWSTAQRIIANGARGQDTVILHLGDHDPSGLDMTRDIREKMETFEAGRYVDVRRIALNMDQIEQYGPPPNPAKEVDPRFANYEAEFGSESWELDALDPVVLDRLIRTHVGEIVDWPEWCDRYREQEETRFNLNQVKDNWPDAKAWLEDEYGGFDDIAEDDDAIRERVMTGVDGQTE